jgi:hypothetical protein
MRKTFIWGLLILSAFRLFGQNASDSIEVRHALGIIFLQNGKKLAPRNLLEITKSNMESYSEMKTAKTNYDAGYVFGSVGGFLAGWPLGTAIGGGKPNWALAAVGAGLIIVSIPFSTAYSKHAKNAVGLYNNGLKQTGHTAVKWKMGLTSSGAGIRLIF